MVGKKWNGKWKVPIGPLSPPPHVYTHTRTHTKYAHICTAVPLPTPRPKWYMVATDDPILTHGYHPNISH
jgi:hypothetical protein